MRDFWSHNSSVFLFSKDSARRGAMRASVANFTRFGRVRYFGHMNLLRFALFLLVSIASMYGMSTVYLHLPSKSTIHVGKNMHQSHGNRMGQSQ